MIKKIKVELVNDNDSDTIFDAIKTLLPDAVINVQSVNFPQKWTHNIEIIFNHE